MSGAQKKTKAFKQNFAQVYPVEPNLLGPWSTKKRQRKYLNACRLKGLKMITLHLLYEFSNSKSQTLIV